MRIKELFAYICVSDAAAAIRFYTEAFGASEKFSLKDSSGRIGHAELDIDGITLMLSDEFPEYGITAPPPKEGPAFTIHLHVDNADKFLDQAVAAGASVESAAADQFYGERSGTIRDPFGYRWNIGHTIEEVSPEEMQRRYTEMTKG